jgi:hypothetical protein
MLTMAQNYLLSQVKKHEMLVDIQNKESLRINQIAYADERESFLNVQSLNDSAVKSDVQNLESI